MNSHLLKKMPYLMRFVTTSLEIMQASDVKLPAESKVVFGRKKLFRIRKNFRTYKYLFGRLVSIDFVIVHVSLLFFELTLRKNT